MARKRLNIALIGTKFMGKTHSNAFRAAKMFFDLSSEPAMKVICGRDPGETEAAARTFGWEEWSTDWKAVVQRDDIDVVDVCTPGYLHHPMVIAAAKAGKHIICEKPLANTSKEAREMTAAVKKAGVKHLCGFSYRFAPAIGTMKAMIRKGQLGEIFHFRAAYQQDWIVDPNFPINWRLQKKTAGSGALGDIGAHIIDMCHHLVGPVGEVSAALQTFVKERPAGEGASIAAKRSGKGTKKKAKVDVDDAAVVIARIQGQPTLATFEATRFAPGRRNWNCVEVYGSKGSVVWSMEHMNYFQYYDAADPDHAQGFRLVHATDAVHPYQANWWPAGHLIGYEHLFTHEVVDFIRQLNRKTVDYPTFDDGLACQQVLDAVEKAAKTGRWVKVS